MFACPADVINQAITKSLDPLPCERSVVTAITNLKIPKACRNRGSSFVTAHIFVCFHFHLEFWIMTNRLASPIHLAAVLLLYFWFLSNLLRLQTMNIIFGLQTLNNWNQTESIGFSLPWRIRSRITLHACTGREREGEHHSYIYQVVVRHVVEKNS